MRRSLYTFIATIFLLWPAAARGQVADVSLSIEPDAVGVGGVVQPGRWTPMRLEMTNRSSQLRPVVARWILSDEDGDEVLAERTAPLNPGVTQRVWLYAPVPMTLRQTRGWVVQVIDAETRRELARRRAAPGAVLAVTSTLIGVCGSVDMGLHDYEPGYTQHEPTMFVRGLQLSQLPDRWYGLESLHALIWTSADDDPLNDPQGASLTPRVAEALRRWVRRGGRLVLVLPTDQTWSDSPLADLMPIGKDRMRRVDDFDALLLGTTPPGEERSVPATVFDVEGQQGVAVLAVDRQQRPYVVARRYGFGRVTLIGVDLTSPAVRRLGVPNGQQRIWNRVFNWSSPVVTEQVYQSETRENKMLSMTARQGRGARLDEMVGGLVAMTGTAAPALLSAILIFALYWMLAGPVAFFYLRNRGKAQHAWLAFVALAGLFTAITWGGALVMRPAHTKLEHLTILDVDANTGDVHTQSWLTLLVPQFGTATVAVDRGENFAGQTLASPGLETRSPGGEFLDPQPYVLPAADPRSVTIPVRSTAKRFTLDYLGKLDTALEGINHAWLLPSGQVRMDEQDAWPVADLTHRLPGPLKNVLVIYCPGTLNATGAMRAPWVGLVPEWPADQALELKSPPAIPMAEMVRRPQAYVAQRAWQQEGYLGQLIALHKGRAIDPNVPMHVPSITDQHFRQLTMLSFFDMLPAPNFRDTSALGTLTATHYERTLLRAADMTHLLAGRRLIIIGQLENSPLPAPLTLDGAPIPADGLTVVRWMYDL